MDRVSASDFAGPRLATTSPAESFGSSLRESDSPAESEAAGHPPAAAGDAVAHGGTADTSWYFESEPEDIDSDAGRELMRELGIRGAANAQAFGKAIAAAQANDPNWERVLNRNTDAGLPHPRSYKRFIREPGGTVITWFVDPEDFGAAANGAAIAPRYDHRTIAEQGRQAVSPHAPQYAQAVHAAIDDADKPMLRALAEELRQAQRAQTLPPELQKLGADYLIVEAVRRGDARAVKTLRALAIEDFSRLQPSGFAQNPLEYRRLYPEVAVPVLFPLEARDALGNTVFHYAASHGAPDVLRALYEFPTSRSSQLHPRNHLAQTPLHLAARSGDVRILDAISRRITTSAADARERKLLRLHLHLHDADGDTPLHGAVKSGSLPAVAKVTNMGAALADMNVAGVTAEEAALAQGRADIAQFLRRTAIGQNPPAASAISPFDQHLQKGGVRLSSAHPPSAKPPLHKRKDSAYESGSTSPHRSISLGGNSSLVSIPEQSQLSTYEMLLPASAPTAPATRIISPFENPERGPAGPADSANIAPESSRSVPTYDSAAEFLARCNAQPTLRPVASLFASPFMQPPSAAS